MSRCWKPTLPSSSARRSVTKRAMGNCRKVYRRLNDPDDARGGVHAVVFAVRGGFDGEEPESRASSHSHGQKARFKAMSCMRTTMSAVHTTEPSGTGSEALIPRGRRGVVSAPRRTRSVTLMSPHASNSPRCFNLARETDVNRRECGGNPNLLRYHIVEIRSVR